MKIITKLQSGGELPPFASFISVVQPATQSAISTPSAEKTSEKTSKKEKIGLLTDSMIDTLSKNGLYSDVNAFLDASQALENDITANPFSDNDSTDLTKYRRLIGLLPLVTKGYKDLTEATTKASSKNALNEIAVSSNGAVFVQDQKTGEIKSQLLDNVDLSTTKVLTNADLVNIRQNDTRYALTNGSGIVNVINNATSMQDIMKWMSGIIDTAKASSNKTEGTMILPDSGGKVDMSKVNTGIAALQDILAHVQSSIDPKDPAIRNAVGADKNTSSAEVISKYSQLWISQNFGEKGIYKLSSENKSNAAAINYAVTVIERFMPANYKTLLQYTAATNLGANNSEGIQALIATLAANSKFSEYSSSTNLILNKNQTSKASTKESDFDKMMDHKQGSSEAFILGEGLYEPHQITLGGNETFNMYGIKGTPMDGKSGPLGISTLNQLSTSNFGPALDLSKATLGGTSLDSAQLSNFMANANDILSVDLPIDMMEFQQHGIARPDLKKLEQLEAVHKIMAQSGLLTKLENAKANVQNGIPIPKALIDQVNKVYRDHNLDLLLNSNGSTNLVNYRRFAMLSGYIPESALPSNINMGYLKEIDNDDQNKNLQEQLHKLNPTYTVNKKGWFGGTDMYQGTVFIPINKDILGSIYASGDKMSAKQTAMLQGTIQHEQERKPMVQAPNLLNGD